jgi:hypothetical protein
MVLPCTTLPPWFFWLQLDGSYNSLCSSTHLKLWGQQSSLESPYHPDYKNFVTETYYSIQCLSKGLPVSSLFCYTSLSLHAHLGFVFLSQIFIYVLCLSSALSSQCIISSLCAMPLSVHFSYCTYHASTRMNNSQQKQKKNIFSILRIFIMTSPLPYHTPNTSSSLTIMSSLFYISNHYVETIHHQLPFLRFFSFFW